MTTQHSIRTNVTDNTLVAGGVAADGFGVVTGYSARGPLLHSRFLDIAKRCGIEEGFYPTPKGADVQLARAIAKVASVRRLDAKPERKRDRQTVEARNYDTRWLLVGERVVAEGEETPGLVPGAPVGSIVLVATLYDDEDGQSLDLLPADSDEAKLVREEFDRLLADQEYQAVDTP